MTSTPTTTADRWGIDTQAALNSVYSPTETQHGRYGAARIPLPPIAVRPLGPIADAMTELERRYDQRDEVRNRLRSLQSQAARAVELDREAAAAAVAVGNKLPASTAPKIRAKLSEAERELPAVQATLIDTFRALLDALDQDGAHWLAAAEQDDRAASRRYAAAVAELHDARHALCAARALPAWLTNIRDRGHVARFQPPLVELPTEWRNRFDITTLLDAIQADADQFSPKETS